MYTVLKWLRNVLVEYIIFILCLDVTKPIQLKGKNVSYCEGFCKIWTTVSGSRWIAVNVVDPRKRKGMRTSER